MGRRDGIEVDGYNILKEASLVQDAFLYDQQHDAV